MVSVTRLTDWTRVDATERGPRTLVVLPIGALEQHGPHLPLGTDTILAEHIACAAADAIADRVQIAVAPAMPYGCSQHHLTFGGTASIQTEHLIASFRDIVGSLLISRFGAVFILNGHGGNQEIVRLVARDISLSQRANVGAGSYFEIARSQLDATGIAGLGEVPGHAGSFETSLMLAARPELVHMHQAPARRRPQAGWPVALPYRVARPGPFRGEDGFSDDPSGADGELGALALAACVEAVSAALAAFAADVWPD